MSESPEVSESTPAISVVVPTYGRPEAVKVAVETVKAQSINDWELIIVDDNPPDSPARKQTRKIMQGVVNEQLNYIELPRNSGACAARNAGVQQARAPYIAFLDDDDQWHRDKLKNSLDCFKQDPQLDLMIHNIIQVYNQVETAFDYSAARTGFFDYFLAAAMGVSCSALVVRKSSFLEVAGFDEQMQSYQDLDLMLRMAKVGKTHVLTQELLRYQLDDFGITFNYNRKISGASRLLVKFHDEFQSPAGQQGFLKLNEALGDYYMMAGNSKQASRAYQQAKQPGFKYLLKRTLASCGLSGIFKTLLRAKKHLRK